MLRKFGFFVVFFGLALPVLAADSPGSISGYVRSTAGVPQMGAAVEVLSAAARTLKVFTDENGFYSIHDLLPGNYSLKVTAPSFLPALRDRIGRFDDDGECHVEYSFRGHPAWAVARSGRG